MLRTTYLLQYIIMVGLNIMESISTKISEEIFSKRKALSKDKIQTQICQINVI